MTNDDFKKLLDESLNPLRKDLGELKGNQEKLKEGQEELKYTAGELKQTIGELKQTIDSRVLPSVTYIETNIKAYRDSYQVNNANAKKLEKRVEILEDKAGVIPPSELTLAEVN